MGYVRQYYSVENKFVEGVLQRGMSNVLTANMGSRLADNYQAFLAGGVLATSVGAFGLNTVFSSAHVENNEKQQGWRVEASYSKTFTTGTNLVLAAYRYSTSGYRDLQDVLGVRRQEKKRHPLLLRHAQSAEQLLGDAQPADGRLGHVELYRQHLGLL